VHDNLRVLASYGVLSGLAATFTGAFVYSELSGWGVERQALYVAIAAAHCWGMRSLSLSEKELRGSSPQKAKSEDEGTGQSDRAVSSGEKALQTVEMTATRAAETVIGGSASSSAGRERGKNAEPLLNFSEPSTRRTVDDDALMEEQLFAKALAGIDADTAGLGDSEDAAVTSEGWAASWKDGIAKEADSPQFDADFEEIMRRFGEDDDKASVQPITELALESFDLASEKAIATASPVADATPPAPTVLAFDAQTLMDSAAHDDEDELLKSIEDIP